MTPEMIVSQIKKTWKKVTPELVRQKRLDPNVYDKVVTTLAYMKPRDTPFAEEKSTSDEPTK